MLSIFNEIIAISLFGDVPRTCEIVFPRARAYTAMAMNNYIPAWTYGFFLVIQTRINRLYLRVYLRYVELSSFSNNGYF